MATKASGEEPKQFAGKKYRGIDRLPWEDVELLYYNGSRDLLVKDLMEALGSSSLSRFGIRAIPEFSLAKKVFDSFPERNEIIAVSVEKAGDLFGEILDYFEIDGDISFLGFDEMAHREWSIIAEGPCVSPENFDSFKERLNNYCLLDSVEDSIRLREEYLNLAKENIVEPLMENPEFLTISIYKISAVS
ncbi:hypothetical protein AB4Z01_26555 [Inquilinus sp. YAF38]|uniref:hypothetical protein n=1 Tax=Inquilinus sp. YAF38 TaxID=3233084 RepID=UPI003F8DF9C3